MTTTRNLCLLSVFLLLAACASQPRPPPLYDLPGFFAGLFHGVFILPAFAISLFADTRIYAFPNAGVLYDAGFLIGVIVSLNSVNVR